MARRKRRRRFGSEPEVHRDKANHAFSDSAHHAALSKRAAERGECANALRELLIANGAYEEAKAHIESNGGRPGSRWAVTARRAVNGAEDEVGSSCFCLRD